MKSFRVWQFKQRSPLGVESKCYSTDKKYLQEYRKENLNRGFTCRPIEVTFFKAYTPIELEIEII